MKLLPLNPSQKRKIRAYSLRKQGKTYREIAQHPEIGPVSVHRASQLAAWGQKVAEARSAELKLQRQPRSSDVLAWRVDQLNLFADRARACDTTRSRVYNSLAIAQITTIGELIQLTEPRLLSLYGFGRTSLLEVKVQLSRIGLALAPHVLPNRKTPNRKTLDMYIRTLERNGYVVTRPA